MPKLPLPPAPPIRPPEPRLRPDEASRAARDRDQRIMRWLNFAPAYLVRAGFALALSIGMVENREAVFQFAGSLLQIMREFKSVNEPSHTTPPALLPAQRGNAAK